MGAATEGAMSAASAVGRIYTLFFRVFEPNDSMVLAGSWPSFLFALIFSGVLSRDFMGRRQWSTV